MRITDDVLNFAYDRTSGYCHICGRKVCFTNHGRVGGRGAWEVDHSRARARGGTDRASNLYAACLPCNRSKGTRSSRSARAAHGRTRAPLSRARRAERRDGKVHIVEVKASANAKPIKNANGEVTGYEIDPKFTPNQQEAYPWAQQGAEVRIKGGTTAGDDALERLRAEGVMPDGAGGVSIGDVRVEVFSPANLDTPISRSIGTRTNRAGNVVPDGTVQVR